MAFKDFSKKIVDNITKGLLQNYQNFTSQNQSSWVMGRLNGDGTATLPDGSTVKVITRGITGTYVRLFNMGNGTWLADVPSSGHVQADSARVLKGWFITPIFKEKSPIPNLSPATFLSEEVKINYVNSTVNTLYDCLEVENYYISNIFTGQKVVIPETFFADLRAPSLEYTLTPVVGPFGVTSFSLNANGNISSNFPFVYSLTNYEPNLQRYANVPGNTGILYQKPQAIFSLDGKHLIVYSMSNVYDQRHGESFDEFIDYLAPTRWNVNIGSDLYIQYKVYKNIAIDFDSGSITWSDIESNLINFSPADFPLQETRTRPIGSLGRSGSFSGSTFALVPQIISYSNQANELVVDLMYSVFNFEVSTTYNPSGVGSETIYWSNALYLFKDTTKNGKNNKLKLDRYLSGLTYYQIRALSNPVGEYIDGLVPNLLNGKVYYTAVKGPVEDTLDPSIISVASVDLHPTSVLLLDDSWNVLKTLKILDAGLLPFSEVLDNELLFNLENVIVGQDVSTFLESLGYSKGNYPAISGYTFFGEPDRLYSIFSGARTARNYATFMTNNIFQPESQFYWTGVINRLAQCNLGAPLSGSRWAIPATLDGDFKLLVVNYNPATNLLRRDREISIFMDPSLVFLVNPDTLPQGDLYVAWSGLQQFNTLVSNAGLFDFPFEGNLRMSTVNDMYIGY